MASALVVFLELPCASVFVVITYSNKLIVIYYLLCGFAGLRELTLSANPGISSKGWARLSIAVAHSSQLRVLNLDYNPLGKNSIIAMTTAKFPVMALSLNMVPILSPGDQIAAMLAVTVASSRTLEVLDLEGTGLTNQSAQVYQLVLHSLSSSL